jgi:hypothetical protein
MGTDWTEAYTNLKQGYPKWSTDELHTLKASLREIRGQLRDNTEPESEIDTVVNTIMEQAGEPVLKLKKYLDPFPFSTYLKRVWINDDRYPDHGPKVLAAMNHLVFPQPQLDDVLRGGRSRAQLSRLSMSVTQAMQILSLKKADEADEAANLLRIAALYHDIGKYIISERHPVIGWHIIQHMDPKQKDRLRDFCRGEESFRLLMVVLRDHDQFGVLSTGEASFPILLGAANSGHGLDTQEQIISALLLCNLADMAGVPKLEFDGEAADRLLDDWQWYLGALRYCAEERIYLDEYVIREASRISPGPSQVQKWEADLMKRDLLFSVPSVCERIRRLLMECSREDPDKPETRRKWMERRRRLSSPQVIYDRLQTVFGSDNTLREFALRFTHICKLDYGKRFFRVLIDQCEWSDDYDQPTSSEQAEQATKAADSAIYATYAILKRITTTYAGMMDVHGTRGNLIGVEMKDLAPDGAPEKAKRIALLIREIHYPGLAWMISDTPAWYF